MTSKFGITSTEVLDAFRRALRYPELLHVCGIHIHVGSQTPDVEPFAAAFKTMWEHLKTIHDESGHALEHINLGGGIPVNYLRDRSQADELPEHEREMLGAELEPADVLAAALRAARDSARDAEAEHLLERRHDPARAGPQRHRRRGRCCSPPSATSSGAPRPATCGSSPTPATTSCSR